MSKLNVLADEMLIKIDNKRIMCKAILLSDRGGHVVSYVDKNGVVVKSQPLYRSPFKDKVKDIKASKQATKQVTENEPAPKQELEQYKIVSALLETCEILGVTQQQIASQYSIPLDTLGAWFSGADAPPDYVLTLLLRCVAIDFSTKQTEHHLLEKEQAPKSAETIAKPTFTFYGIDGKPLSSRDVQTVCRERDNNKLKLISNTQQKDGSKRSRYKCTNGFLFDVITIK